MKYLVCFSLLLVGCSWSEWGTYEIDKNIDQEQNNYSIKSDSVWVNENFPKDCDWINLDRVVDGDTIIVRDGAIRTRIRMIGIDTPESKKEGTPIQAYSLEATRVLQLSLEDDDQVCLIADETGDEYDTYGRRLSYVFAEDGQDLNAHMISVGLAKAYLSFPLERKSEFRELQKKAQQEAIGRWE